MTVLKRILAASALAAAVLGGLAGPALADSTAPSASAGHVVTTAGIDNNHSS
ncbi:hypothetical protein [Streptomyces albus]|uniref:hypothetical protein n=1 Tax=Streptomyces albus TaxID=1888 RepID=UPI000A4C3D74|nr:hypothetical protein [Streptomyces albus]